MKRGRYQILRSGGGSSAQWLIRDNAKGWYIGRTETKKQAQLKKAILIRENGGDNRYGF